MPPDVPHGPSPRRIPLRSALLAGLLSVTGSAAAGHIVKGYVADEPRDKEVQVQIEGPDNKNNKLDAAPDDAQTTPEISKSLIETHLKIFFFKDGQNAFILKDNERFEVFQYLVDNYLKKNDAINSQFPDLKAVEIKILPAKDTTIGALNKNRQITCEIQRDGQTKRVTIDFDSEEISDAEKPGSAVKAPVKTARPRATVVPITGSQLTDPPLPTVKFRPGSPPGNGGTGGDIGP